MKTFAPTSPKPSPGGEAPVATTATADEALLRAAFARLRAAEAPSCPSVAALTHRPATTPLAPWAGLSWATAIALLAFGWFWLGASLPPRSTDSPWSSEFAATLTALDEVGLTDSQTTATDLAWAAPTTDWATWDDSPTAFLLEAPFSTLSDAIEEAPVAPATEPAT